MSAGAITGAAPATTLRAGAFGDLSSDEFVKIMLTELSHQDPLDPQDSTALLEQLSSLRNIESQLALERQLEALVLQNQIAAASNLIGKTVEGIDARNDSVAGVVTAVRVQDGTAVLDLDSGAAIEMSRVTAISGPADAPTE